MPRPQPLPNLTSDRPYTSNYDYQSLTPRTPHSRAGRAEEARGTIYPEIEYELEVIPGLGDRAYDNPYGDLQREPLLTSSTSASFPHRRRTFADSERERKWKRTELSWSLVLSRLPLALWGATALTLLFLIVMSISKPEALRKAVGASKPSDDGLGKELEETVAIPAATDAATTPTKTAKIISYSSYTSFPLEPSQYFEECSKYTAGLDRVVGDYWHVPEEGSADVIHKDESIEYQKTKTHTHLPEMEEKRICSSSITYMLDGYVGLVADLALMSQAAALAREQNRSFFVLDNFWNRGKWTDHFQDVRHRQPGPEPGCIRPPPEELVACPRTARHWVINSRTARFHFGHKFEDEYEDPYARQLRRKKPSFDFAAKSLSQTIRPNAQNAALIRAARQEIEASLADVRMSDGQDSGIYVGVHIRRGDRKAEAWPNRDSYIPIKDYEDAVESGWERLLTVSPFPSTYSSPVIWLASDSPDARAELIRSPSLPKGTKLFSLDRSSNEELRSLASPEEYFQEEYNKMPYEDRVRLTRGALVDFAMLCGMWVWEDEARPMATVCTLSSSFCKLAAVGLGWNRAFGMGESKDVMTVNDEVKRWIEIDDKGMIAPVWRPFELF